LDVPEQSWFHEKRKSRVRKHTEAVQAGNYDLKAERHLKNTQNSPENLQGYVCIFQAIRAI
jgi:hypothetical protein